MASIKAGIVTSNRRKDGTYAVIIRVTHKGKSRRLPTTLSCTAGDITRSGKIKNPTILDKADALVGQLRGAISSISPFDLELRDVDWLVSRIKSELSVKNFRLDFFEYADAFLQGKSEPTRAIYESTLNAFARYLGQRHIDINDIRKQMILDFIDDIERSKKMHGTRNGARITCKDKVPHTMAKLHIGRLSHIFKSAKDRYNDDDAECLAIPRSPFNGIVLAATAHHGQPNVGVDVMQRIIAAHPKSPAMRQVLDLFVISFGTMGANLADIYSAKQFNGEWWIYNRRKTSRRRADHAEMRVKIPEVLAPFIERLKGNGEWWLNSLHESTQSALNQRVNSYLSKWCASEGLQPFTLYAARHTWASLARTECGIDKATIDDCLCHKGDYQLADIYSEKAWALMQSANEQVLGLFDWSGR